jgi:drug/metabolite transporter superfamily protein YnfA
MNFLAEIWAFLRSRKKLWLLPIVVVMLLIGGLLVLAQGSAVAPFIYTLF